MRHYFLAAVTAVATLTLSLAGAGSPASAAGAAPNGEIIAQMISIDNNGHPLTSRLTTAHGIEVTGARVDRRAGADVGEPTSDDQWGPTVSDLPAGEYRVIITTPDGHHVAVNDVPARVGYSTFVQIGRIDNHYWAMVDLHPMTQSFRATEVAAK